MSIFENNLALIERTSPETARRIRAASPRAGLEWIETDEGHSVVLRFDEYRLGIAPYSFVRFGERVGQGYRCAYLRLAHIADVFLPVDSKVHVEPGQRVKAGTDLIAALQHP